ncbi:hypothetical protein ACROYT_G019376 [Oculina patagonica]
MFPVRQLVFTLFTECNGLTTFLNSSQNGSFDMYMDSLSNRSCTWLITASIGQRVLIYFTKFHLPYCSDYYSSSVTITDGTSPWSSRLAKYCGRDLPRPVYSSGRQILITFQPSLDYAHFTLRYSTLSQQSSSCPSIDPGASFGVIYSPNFPWYNTNSKLCDWSFKVLNSYDRININFTYIQPDGNCKAYVEILNIYDDVIRTVTLCTTPVSITYSFTIRVRYYPDFTSSSFLAFYQRGDNVPVPWTTYAPPWYTTQSRKGCQTYSDNSIYIQSSGSTSVSSSAGRRVRYTVPPDTTCTWQIATTEGYTLELKFDEMSISGKYSCYECSCGYVRVMDGYGSSARSLGTFCDENIPSVVSSTGNHMFIKYYAQREFDYFKASINSRETQAHRYRIAGIVVPIVIGIVLFATIVAVIKCIKIRRSTGSAGEQGSAQVPFLLEPIESSPDDEEMIDLTQEENNTASGTTETV